MDIRRKRMMPYTAARETVEEKHVCPLQLDVIERCLTLWSNHGETMLTPFMGVGSEVYGALINGRKGIGVELKPTYYRQALANVKKTFDENFSLDNQRSICEMIAEDEEEDEPEDDLFSDQEETAA
jgi:DNA modification methylase